MNFFNQTNYFIEECDRCVHRFFQMREQNVSPNFYEDVKPYIDVLDQRLNDWQNAANQWIHENRPKYVHEQQIANAVEAIGQFAVQSFYKETSKKRFLQSVQSVKFTLTSILRNLDEHKMME